MKKIRELLKSKKNRWTAGGLVCLVTGSLLFALGSGIGVRAEEITLGSQKIEFAKTGTSYVVATADQLTALGNATVDQTKDKTFQLKNDIEIKVTKAASGTFAGTFDGNGHVIKVTAENVTSTGTDDVVSEGLLFGTVTGSVKNVIVDVQNDVNYTRTSKVTKSENEQGTPQIDVTKEVTAPYEGTDSFSSFSTDSGAKKLAEKFNEYVDGSADIVKGSDGKTYYRVSEKENITKTTTYTLKENQTDQFGIICGTLSENAEISQVYVKGNGSLNVKQDAGKVSTITTQTGTRDRYFYYEQSTGSHDETVKPNKAVEGITVNVTYQTEAAAEGSQEQKVTYTLTITNNVKRPEGASNVSVIIKTEDISLKLGENPPQGNIAWKWNGESFGSAKLDDGQKLTLTATLKLKNSENPQNPTAIVKVSEMTNTYDNVNMYQ